MRQHALALGSIWDVPWKVAEGAMVSSHNSCSNGNGKSQQSKTDTGTAGSGSYGPNGTAVQKQCSDVQQALEFTTWKFRSDGVAKRTIDYIWYSKQQLVPISRWRMLSEAEIGPQGLPNMIYPSDHMCVTCEFGWSDC